MKERRFLNIETVAAETTLTCTLIDWCLTAKKGQFVPTAGTETGSYG